MHELRANLISGTKRIPLARKEAVRSTPGPEEASLGTIKIRRTESRRCDQRREARKVEIVDLALIRYHGQTQQVTVRNVSSRGMMIEADILPAIGARIDVAFEGCNPMPCSVRWVRDGRIGLEFARETLVLMTDAEGPVSGRRAGERPTIAVKRDRQPRQVLFLRGQLHWAQGSLPVKLRNLSAEGMMIDSPSDLIAGVPVVVEIPGGQAVSGHVRWCRSGQIGIKFEAPLDLETLIRPPEPPRESADYVKPEYLESDGKASSPWAARWERLSLDDL